jgi:heme oxygenase
VQQEILLVSRLVDQLLDQTRELQIEADSELDGVMSTGSAADYRRYLSRMFGFVRPLELALERTPGLERVIELRRFRKHRLIKQDLDALGMKPADIDALPQCTTVPWFETVPDALGWAFIVERQTRGFPSMYRFLATTIPGEIAFAAAYLKCYPSFAAMWDELGDAIDASQDASVGVRGGMRVIDAAKAGFRHYRRFRHALDGKSVSAAEAAPVPSPRRASTEST